MSASRPLQNRVDPYGALVAVAARGALMGNRGGRFHRPDRTLGRRRWASRQWISCLCAFQGRRRERLGLRATPNSSFSTNRPRSPPAIGRASSAAAPTPRRSAAPSRPAAAEARRRSTPSSIASGSPTLPGRFVERRLAELPDGTMVERGGRPYAVRGAALLPWSFFGYGAPEPRPASERARC